MHQNKFIAMNTVVNFPRQQLPFNQKGRKWRKECMDWADNKTFYSSTLVRNTVEHKKINYDLLQGKLHMKDLMLVVNPENLNAKFIPDRIQHYAIMNSKLNVLRGEEAKRIFDARIVVTNPTAISEIEEKKKEVIFQMLQQAVEDRATSEEDFQKRLEEINQYSLYQYQDFREMRANFIYNHYSKEQNFALTFNTGIMDAMAVGEEIYQCDIVSGEPVLTKLNPLKVRIWRNGYSNRIEDADIIMLEDYWSPGKIIDTYYDSLTPKDMKYIEKINNSPDVDEFGTIDERHALIRPVDEELYDGFFATPEALFGSNNQVNDLMPYDNEGNIRVLRLYWKSRRKIKKVKKYDPETGEIDYHFYTEEYIADKFKGEEEQTFWINEAWEGTKIGKDIYVNIRPRLVQYNTMSNPSKCHFGIIGSIYNLNDDRPFSLLDIMKPYNYLYDVIHDRLNKLMARNLGKLTIMDLAQIPKGWEAEKWIYYAKVNGILVKDSGRVIETGPATGKLAGSLNNASSGVVDAEWGNNIQQYINLLEFIKLEMSEVAGISKQREGQISNRETVGGVERATLQSSHITEWLFTIHDDVKKRVIECFIDTARVAMRGRNMKFRYITPDFATKMIDIDGDEFAENEYGLVADNSSSTQDLNNKIEMLAQAALQNQALTFSAIMKLYSSASMAEKLRMIEQTEQEMQQRAEQAQQQQLQQQQQAAEMEQQTAMKKMEQEDLLNQRDNETKLMVAEINSQAEAERLAMMNNDTNMDGIRDDERRAEDLAEAKEDRMLKMKELDEKFKLEREKLNLAKKKQSDDVRLKEKQISKMGSNNSKK